MLMLGNEVPLWETVLAAMKLGVIVTPATPLPTAADLGDRIERGAVAHVVAGHANTFKFDNVPGTYTRIAVGRPVRGWQSYEDSRAADAAFTPETATADL
jgi:acetyl-CoA synthetase